MILFKPVYVWPIVRLQKRVTRRPYNAHRERQFPVGSVHGAYCRPPWSGGKPFAKLRVLVTSVDCADEVTSNKEARLEGFRNAAAFRDAIRATYAELDGSAPLLRIEFELVEVDLGVVKLLTVESRAT